MLQVHQCVAAVGVGFDAGAEERRRTCSIDPRTQPVLTLRQSSLRLVAVCPSTAYGRIGLWFFASHSWIFFRQSAYTSPLYRTIIVLHIILLISDFVVKKKRIVRSDLCYLEGIYIVRTHGLRYTRNDRDIDVMHFRGKLKLFS